MQNRNKSGQFARKTKIALFIIIFVGIFSVWFFALDRFFYDLEYVRDTAAQVTETIIPVAHAGETTEAKLENLKEKIVNDLAACETQGVKEPDATILLNSNNQMSIGSWQYQIKTVQHYIKVFEQRDIDRVEAIQIAIDHDRAEALTAKILFEENGGWKNWFNCGNKLGLGDKIDIITQLEN